LDSNNPPTKKGPTEERISYVEQSNGREKRKGKKPSEFRELRRNNRKKQDGAKKKGPGSPLGWRKDEKLNSATPSMRTLARTDLEKRIGRDNKLYFPGLTKKEVTNIGKPKKAKKGSLVDHGRTKRSTRTGSSCTENGSMETENPQARWENLKGVSRSIAESGRRY